jgi:hypothetical protein
MKAVVGIVHAGVCAFTSVIRNATAEIFSNRTKATQNIVLSFSFFIFSLSPFV